MNSGLEKHEKFHVIIFMLVFVYFYVLKITNHVEISWVALVFPLILGIVLFYLIRYIKNKA
jgi:Flp pilus assembly protein TadB